jgi:hypothetical protein
MRRRAPIDRVVDLVVAAPWCAAEAARRSLPVVAAAIRRGLDVGPPPDHDLGGAATTVADDDDAGDTSVEAAVAIDVDEALADAARLPIEDYDQLAARQVVDRLDALQPAELRAVRAYESSHRHRQTILRRIEQLLA